MKLFKFFYVICLLGSIVFGDIPVFSIIIVRYVAVAAMFVLCCTQKISFPKNSVYIAYFAFILIFFLISVFSGYATDFLKVFFGGYFVSIVWIWATYILIKKYDSLQLLLTTLFIICTINAVVTIGQYFRNPFAFGVSYLLNAVDTDVVTSMEEHAGMSDTFGGFAMYGLFGAVPNGYYSAVFSVISCTLLFRSKTFLFKVFSLSFWFFSIFSLFCVQERAALLGGVLFSSLYVLKILSSNRKGKFLLTLAMTISAFVLFYNSSELLSITEGTRYESFDLDSRTTIFSSSQEYVLNHPLTANLFEYVDQYKKYPHHLFHYSFMCGTLIGGLVILGALAYILLIALRVSLRSFKIESEKLITIAFALFAYVVPSLTHNDSIASGATLFWLLAASLITSADFSKKRVSPNIL